MREKIKHTETHSVTSKRTVLGIFFTVLLSACTVLGALPITVHTPLGTVSTEVSEAEARNRNTTANRPRSLQARNAGADLVQRFSANRRSYTVNVRQSTNRANIRIGIREGQQHRWRIDTRRTNGTWSNGSYNSWRTTASRNINRNIRVNVSQGQERRLRVQIRDRSENVRTININVRRASGNTWGANLRFNAGTLNPATFNRAVTNYTLTIPHNRTAATQVGMRAAQERGQTRNRVRIQNADGSWRTWSSWSSYTRGQSSRNVGTIPQGRQAQVQFMIRGAFSNMSNSPTRTRTYTVNVVRPNQPQNGGNNGSTTNFPATGTMQVTGANVWPNANVPTGFRVINVHAQWCSWSFHNATPLVIFNAMQPVQITPAGQMNVALSESPNQWITGGVSWTIQEIGDHMTLLPVGEPGSGQWFTSDILLLVDRNNNIVGWWNTPQNVWTTPMNPSNRTFTISW